MTRTTLYVTSFLALFFCGLAISASAQQQESRISGLFTGISFERFVELVEKDSPYRFIFKKEELAEVTVN